MKYLLSLLLLVSGIGSAAAQEFPGGTIVYTRTSTYSFNPTGNPEWDAYARSLPTEGKFEKVLYFTSKASLYDESILEKEATSIPQQKAQFFASYGKPPQPTLKSLYIDFEKEQTSTLQEFMTREFLVESPLKIKGWKLDPPRKKIGEYICMKAHMNLEGDTITAWFTPEIPVPAGPSEYHGLPGVVLAVERLGETIFIATSIDLSSPPVELLVKPERGKKISPQDFNRIVEEKAEEFLKTGADEFYGK